MEEKSLILNLEKILSQEITEETIKLIYTEIISDNKNLLKKHSTILTKLDELKYLENILLNQNIITKEFLFSILIFINHKIYSKNNIFEYISKKNLEEKFVTIFNQILNYELISMNDIEKVIFIQFLINCYQHIEYKFMSNNCLKLLSILLWVNLSKETIKNLLMENEKLIEKWKILIKLSEKDKNIINSNSCTFFNKLLEDYLNLIENSQNSSLLENDGENVEFIFQLKLIEFLIDLISQYSTRKFLLPLIKEKHFHERCIIISQNIKNKNFSSFYKKMLDSLKFYLDFEINEETGEIPTQNYILSKHYSNINFMQNIAFQLFPEKLQRIYLKNISLIDNTENIKEMLNNLNTSAVFNFANKLNLLKYNPEFYKNKKDLIYQLFLNKYERKETILEKINNMSLYPDEKLIWDMELIPDDKDKNLYKSMLIPKLNLQFLTHYDYLLRNFLLFRNESIYEIRNDLQDVIKRMHPVFDNRGNFSSFNGWARMGITIKNFKILNVKSALIGKKYPQQVLGEIEINMKGVQNQIKNEWDKLKRHDVLFLTSFHQNLSNLNEDDNLNVKFIRGCEIISIYDEENNEFTDFQNLKKKKPMGFMRRIHVSLDPIQYTQDLNKNVEEMYSNFHLLIRRKPEQNNFKAILDTIRDLMNSVTVIPNWLDKIFLGYGDPYQAHYTKINQNNRKLDFFDTFIDKEHYDENWMKNEFIVKKEILNNYYVNSVKNEKMNRIRFTKKQVEAIYSGVNHGLTLIVGPPGTGKTDVAVQIVNLIYHNFPHQRTLIVTHSNMALNDIFEKITKLDIDERYLLRLGMGEKDLSFDKDFSKNGRVNYMLKRRVDLLNLVLQLAHSLEIYTFEEYTCEHALNLYEFEIKKRIINFQNNLNSGSQNLEEIFPFKNFLNNLNHDLFDEKQAYINNINYIEEIFKEIEELRAFELLRNNHERGNHLLTKQAKIIAMTCTHAALKRKGFIKLGFEYDNIIMEEAAQILEVETFIPMLLQEESRLKRVVLIGDNNQLPPIIKNNQFKHYGKMDQSLFSRFIRIGVPYVGLDYQGRTRPSIVNLYRWKYPYLHDLPNVHQFNLHNPGFTHQFQFINVNSSESCPSEHYYQNLAEAEYTIAIFMYMCLIGYNPASITILTTYNGQKALLKDIYKQKCQWNPIFNSPLKITTVDKYQGQQNDFILLSLVRTYHPGHLKDVRRLIVALSRSRLGLYVLGNWNLFSNLDEMKQTFEIFNTKPNQLEINLNDERNKLKIEDFQHMYRIVQVLMKIKFSQ